MKAMQNRERGSAGQHQGAAMRDGWQTKRLGDVCTLRPPKAEARQRLGMDSHVSFLPMEDLGIDVKHPIPRQTKKLGDVQGSYTYFADGDVMLAKVTPCFQNGKLGIAKDLTNGVGFGSSEFFVLRPHSDLDSEYLYYFLSRADFKEEGVKRMGGAVGLQRVPPDYLLGESLPVPSLAEQQRIVGILDEAFEGLATAQAHAEKNHQNARALFESHHNSTFGQRREGWGEKPLGEVCEYVNGKAHEQCIDEGGRFIVINSKFISTEGEVFKRSNDALLLLQPGEIAMVLSDVPNGKALAKCFLVEEADTYTLNQRICLIRTTKFHTRFLFYQLNRNRYFLSFDNGENQTNLRLNQVLSCPIFLPPLAEQETIADTLDALSEETQRLARLYERKLAELEALKRSLLHQAFTGEL